MVPAELCSQSGFCIFKWLKSKSKEGCFTTGDHCCVRFKLQRPEFTGIVPWELSCLSLQDQRLKYSPHGPFQEKPAGPWPRGSIVKGPGPRAKKPLPCLNPTALPRDRAEGREALGWPFEA